MLPHACYHAWCNTYVHAHIANILVDLRSFSRLCTLLLKYIKFFFPFALPLPEVDSDNWNLLALDPSASIFSLFTAVCFQRDRHPKHQRAENCRRRPYWLLSLPGCCQGAGLYGSERGVSWIEGAVCVFGEVGGWGGVRVSGLAEGHQPLVRLQWVRRLTEPQQSCLLY